MGTKAIEAVLNEVSAKYGEGGVRKAMRELEAIRNASALIGRHGIHHVTPANFEEVRAAEDLFAAIAKEAES